MNKNFSIQSKSHIFNRFRFHVRFGVAPLMLSYILIDYLYAPEHFLKWMSLRLGFVVYSFVLFKMVVRFKFLRRHIEYPAMTLIVFASGILNSMIAEKGDFQTIYIGGVLQCVFCGILLFRLNRKWALITEIVTFAPTLGLIFYFAGWENWPKAVVSASLLVGTLQSRGLL